MTVDYLEEKAQRIFDEKFTCLQEKTIECSPETIIEKRIVHFPHEHPTRKIKEI
jgi:hypothetical protein